MFRRTLLYVAVSGVGIISGAIFAQIFILGITIKNDEGCY
jgi:hypothetical protein